MSKFTFGREIDMNLLNNPKGDAVTIAYHSGGGGFPKGSLLQKDSSGEVSYVGGSGAVGATGPSGAILYVSKTKQEIDVLITNSQLIPGVLYKITGVHPNLYNDGTNKGTTIYLHALTNKELASAGHGEFYNPKYNKTINGYNIWFNKSTWTVTLISGKFNKNELITSNNGATGTLYSIFESKHFSPVNGNWSASTSITGNVSGAVANISNVIIKTYAIGDKAIWGGYSWTNLTGNIGDFDTRFLLDVTNWKKDVYDEINYNRVLDVIEYDIKNDFIVTRHEIEGGNFVTYPYKTSEDAYWIPNQPESGIQVFQFGNPFDYVEFWCGNANCHINASYFDNLNFIGTHQNIDLTQGSAMFDNISLTNGGLFYNVKLHSYASILNNTLITGRGYIGYIDNNSSEISNNTLFNAAIFSIKISDNSQINNNTTISEVDYFYCYIRGIYMTKNCSVSNNTLYKSRIEMAELSSFSSMDNNTMISTGTIYNEMRFNTLEKFSQINGNTITENGNIGGNFLTNNDKINNNTVIASSIRDNNLKGAGQNQGNSIINNTVNGSTIAGNVMTGNNNISTNLVSGSSSITNNVIERGNNINNNTLSGSSNIFSNSISMDSNINNNVLSLGAIINNNRINAVSSINSNTLITSQIIKNTFDKSSIILGLTFPLTGKIIQNLYAQNGDIAGNIASATTIFQTYSKTLFRRSDNQTRISYYNNLDQVVISDVTT